MKVRMISEGDARAIVTHEVALAEVRKAFIALARGNVTLPASLELDIPEANGELHVKGAYIHGSQFFSVKAGTGFYGNAAAGLPVASGLVLVFDAGTGLLDSIVFDNGYLTEIRTGAAGALAADLLARADARRAGVIGSGGQARYQIEALLGVRSLTDVAVWARTPEAAERYAREMEERTRVPFRVVGSPQLVVQSADVVITSTPSRTPLLEAEWVQPGTHVTAMGSDLPEKHELAPTLVAKADKFVVDSLTQCLRSGELHHAVESIGFEPASVYAELGEVAAGMKAGRQREEEITVADLTGLGVQDAAMANVVAEQARALGLGTTLEI
jgi:ectoine utilization protein EutC